MPAAVRCLLNHSVSRWGGSARRAGRRTRDPGRRRRGRRSPAGGPESLDAGGACRRAAGPLAAPVGVDSQAVGTFHAGPVSLAKFEENAGKTNSSLVRLETNAVFGVERQTAAIRVAAA